MTNTYADKRKYAMTPIMKIQAERKRQVEVEGWTPEHDDQHNEGEMLRAATLYYLHAAKPGLFPSLRPDGAPLGWPWEAKWWKPKDRERDLIRAGALCLAERERFERISYSTHRDHVEQKLRSILKALGQEL